MTQTRACRRSWPGFTARPAMIVNPVLDFTSPSCASIRYRPKATMAFYPWPELVVRSWSTLSPATLQRHQLQNKAHLQSFLVTCKPRQKNQNLNASMLRTTFRQTVAFRPVRCFSTTPRVMTEGATGSVRPTGGSG
jgi:hypothetical protein